MGPLIIVALGILLLYIAQRLLTMWRCRNWAPLPPGPKPLPFLGNILDIPKGHMGRHWAKHKAFFGPISSVNVLGQPIIILNDVEVSLELLRKKSYKSSHRPGFVFGGELCGIDLALAFLQYGDRFHLTRKMMQQFMGTRASVSRFDNLLKFVIRRFIFRVVQSPDQVTQQIKLLVGSVILKLAYGYTVDAKGTDHFVEVSDDAFHKFHMSFKSGEWPVDVLPFLKYLPEWLPGMRFKAIARKWRSDFMNALDEPFTLFKQRAAGSTYPSFAYVNMRRGSGSEYEEDVIKWASLSLYGGGADTTYSAISTFVMSMMLYPKALLRAQKEIDTVVGTERLPSFSDRPNLPYIEAVYKETLRLNVVNQVCLPHVTSEDDVFRGYRIPKGSILIPNIWQFSHDPANYVEPMKFDPERHLKSEKRSPALDPRIFTFGFGGRACPGKEVAESLIWLTIAMCIATCDIKKARDKLGREIDLPPKYAPDPMTYTQSKSFTCSITPRSETAAQHIHEVQNELSDETCMDRLSSSE